MEKAERQSLNQYGRALILLHQSAQSIVVVLLLWINEDISLCLSILVSHTHTCTVSTHTRSCCQHLGLPYRFGRLCTEQTEDRRTVLWTDRLWEKWWEAVEVKGRSRLKLKGVLVRECLAECVQYVCARIFLLKSKKPAAEVFLNTGWFGNRIQVQLQLVQFKISPGATISS